MVRPPSSPATVMILADVEVTVIGHGHRWLRVAIAGEPAVRILRELLHSPRHLRASFTLGIL